MLDECSMNSANATFVFICTQNRSSGGVHHMTLPLSTHLTFPAREPILLITAQSQQASYVLFKTRHL